MAGPRIAIYPSIWLFRPRFLVLFGHFKNLGIYAFVEFRFLNRGSEGKLISKTGFYCIRNRYTKISFLIVRVGNDDIYILTIEIGLSHQLQEIVICLVNKEGGFHLTGVGHLELEGA